MITDIFNQLIDDLSLVPGIAQVIPVPRRLDTVTLPAIFLDIGEMTYGNSPGTEQVPLVIHWEARIVMQDDVEDITLWSLVANVMLQLFTTRWPNRDIGKVKLKQATPDDFTPDLAGFRVWLIEWVQTIHLGDNIWDGDGIVPTEVVIRYQGSDEETTYTLPPRNQSASV